MEAEDKKEYEYEVGDIPTEWDGNMILDSNGNVMLGDL